MPLAIELTALAEVAKSAMAAMRWDSQEGSWLLLRLMAVPPFPAAAAAPGHDAVAALGALFDACRFDSRRLAPVAQTWVTWAVEHSHALGKARLEAYRSPKVAARGAAQAARDRDTALPSRSARHDTRRASNVQLSPTTRCQWRHRVLAAWPAKPNGCGLAHWGPSQRSDPAASAGSRDAEGAAGLGSLLLLLGPPVWVVGLPPPSPPRRMVSHLVPGRASGFC